MLFDRLMNNGDGNKMSEYDIKKAFALIPAIITITGIPLLFFGYRLTREKIVRYQAEIEARSK